MKTALIKKILLAFEQSSTTIQYGKVYTWNDGPGNSKQITVSFGITETGNLKKLIKDYCDKSGRLSKQFEPYLNRIGGKTLADDKTFVGLLQEAGDDVVMQMCQESAFEELYITPALRWCDRSKLTLPLSQLVVADSFLHSGSILATLRNKFPEKLPSLGGNEKRWIESYCIVRKDWLGSHSRKILNKTVYRPNFMLECIEANDWSLDRAAYNANGVKVLP